MRIAAILLLASLAHAQKPATTAIVTATCFSPGGHCVDLVVAQLALAKHTVRVLAYGFSSVPIARALVAAHRRGVDVRLVLDRSNRTGRYSAATYVEHAGVPVAIDSAEPIQHNKVLVIDGETVIQGSYNLTGQAERNGENMLVLRSKELAALYTTQWERHHGHAVVVQAEVSR